MTEAELCAHYAEVRQRLYGEPPAPVRPKPVLVSVDPEPQPNAGPRLLRFAGDCAWKQIVNDITAKTGFEYHTLQHDKGRHVALVRARHECWYRMRTEIIVEHRPAPYPWIGARFDRHHTSIMHGIRSWAARHGLPLP